MEGFHRNRVEQGTIKEKNVLFGSWDIFSMAEEKCLYYVRYLFFWWKMEMAYRIDYLIGALPENSILIKIMFLGEVETVIGSDIKSEMY